MGGWIWLEGGAGPPKPRWAPLLLGPAISMVFRVSGWAGTLPIGCVQAGLSAGSHAPSQG